MVFPPEGLPERDCIALRISFVEGFVSIPLFVRLPGLDAIVWVELVERLLLKYGFEFAAFHSVGRKIPYLWSDIVIVVRKPVSNDL